MYLSTRLIILKKVENGKTNKKPVLIYSKNGSNDFDKGFVKKPLSKG